MANANLSEAPADTGRPASPEAPALRTAPAAEAPALFEVPASTAKLAALLFVSGGCALVFQVVWIRELRLVFGATTLASAAVLAIFMGGLGLGNALLGKRIDRMRRPIRFYAQLEAGIALLAAVSPLLIDLTRVTYVGIGGQSALGLALATLLRLAASTVLLIGPTFCMGGTLPAAARAVTSENDPKRRGLAAIYGFNTLGAVAGAGLANFLLIEALGNRGLLWSACAVNLLLAATAWRYSNRLSLIADRSAAEDAERAAEPEREAPSAEGRVADAPRGRAADAPKAALLYGAAAVVGFVFFQMEIVWYRMLGPLLGGTTYTFGIILCIALLGIGLGGWLYHFCARWIRPTTQLLVATCGLEAFCLAVPFWYGDRVAMWVLNQQLDGVPSFGVQVWNWFQVGAFVILPASAVSGFQFPVLIALAGSGRQQVGRHVGWTFAANTAGAICGSVAGGFFLLPIFSAVGLWQFSVLLLVLLGAAIGLLSKAWNRSLLGLGVASAAGVLASAAILSGGPTAAWRHSGIGAGRAAMEGTGRNAEQDFIHTQRRQLKWEAEGIESSVGITATRDSLGFVVNGKSDGNAYSDAPTQIGLGLLGPLLHPQAERGLVIGLGTGETAGWLADCVSDSVDVVELESVIVTMAEWCAPMNRRALANPKVRMHYNDAREFLLTSNSTYDVIVSEPSNPYRAGIANLYTREFYTAAFDRLAEDGLFLQWLQGYEVDDETVLAVLKTIRSVFPEVQVWRTVAGDMVLVCGRSDRSLAYDERTLTAQLKHPVIGEGLNLAWRVRDVPGVLAHFVCGNATIDALLQEREVPVNSDDRNFLEYAFADSVGKETRFSTRELESRARQAEDLPLPAPQMRERIARRRLAMQLGLAHAIPPAEEVPEEQRAIAAAYAAYLSNNFAESVNRMRAIGIDIDCPIERVVFAHGCAEAGISPPDEVLERIRSDNPTEAAAIQAISALQQGNRKRGREELLKTFSLLKSNPWGNRQLLEAALRYAVLLSSAEPAAAEAIFAALEKPFAMYRLENGRLLARFVISEKRGPRQVAEALEAFEPNVPWLEWVLRTRRTVYRELQSPLLEQAEADLEQFKAWDRN